MHFILRSGDLGSRLSIKFLIQEYIYIYVCMYYIISEDEWVGIIREENSQ